MTLQYEYYDHRNVEGTIGKTWKKMKKRQGCLLYQKRFEIIIVL